MKKMLRSLLSHSKVLFDDERLTIVSGRTLGNSASHLNCQYGPLCISFICEKGEFLATFSSTELPDEQFAYNHLYQLMTGQRLKSAILDKRAVVFINQNLDAIIEKFEPSVARHTYAELKRIEERADAERWQT